jgi:hypothetical protein
LSGSGTLEKKNPNAGAESTAARGPLGWVAAHKLIAIIVAAVVLAGGATAFLLTQVSGDKRPPHTPNLGIEFWQVRKADKVSTSGGRSTVKLSQGPFVLRFPVVPIDNGPRICAWTDDSVFTLKAGSTMDQYPCFKPGSVLPTPSVGATDLILSTTGHNNLVGDRLVEVDGDYDQVSIASLYRAGADDAPLGWATDVYLAVFLDKNRNNIIDKGEFDFVVLDF